MAELHYARLMTDLGNVEVYSDFHNGVHYMQVAPDATPGEMREALSVVADLGLEPMDEDECPSEMLDAGIVRVWLAQIGSPTWP